MGNRERSYPLKYFPLVGSYPPSSWPEDNLNPSPSKPNHLNNSITYSSWNHFQMNPCKIKQSYAKPYTDAAN